MNHENFGFLLHSNNGAQASKKFGHCLWFAFQTHIGPCTAIQSISASDTLNTEFLSTLSYLTTPSLSPTVDNSKWGSLFGRKNTDFPSQVKWLMRFFLIWFWQNVSNSRWMVDDIIRDLMCALCRTRKWLDILTAFATAPGHCCSSLHGWPDLV